MMTLLEFKNCISSNSEVDASQKLMLGFPHAYQLRNDSQRLLYYVAAWTLCVLTRGIGLIIDDAISEKYAEMMQALADIGAEKSFEYTKKAADICGGTVPVDELERAEITLRFESEFIQLDRLYRKQVGEEAAKALIKRFSVDAEKTYNELAQGG